MSHALLERFVKSAIALRVSEQRFVRLQQPVSMVEEPGLWVIVVQGFLKIPLRSSDYTFYKKNCRESLLSMLCGFQSSPVRPPGIGLTFIHL